MGKNEAGETGLDWLRCVLGGGGVAQLQPCGNKVTQTGATAGEQLERTGGTVWVVQQRGWGGGGAERVQVRDGDIENRSYYRESRAEKESRKEKRKKGWREAATCGLPLYPCNYSESMLVNI